MAKIKDGRNFLQQDDAARALICFETAAQMYGEGLLPSNRYDAWCDEHRDQYQCVFTDTLRTMAGLYMKQRNIDEAIKVYRQLLSLDNWDEDAYLDLMRCYVLQGRDLQAITLYRHCEKILLRDLDTVPGQTLQEFVQRILRRRSPAVVAKEGALSSLTGMMESTDPAISLGN